MQNTTAVKWIVGILLFFVEACSGLKTQETRAECPNHEFYLKCKALDRVETFIDVRWKVWNPHTQQWVDLGLHCKSRTSCPEKKANISDRVELAISNPNATLRVRHFMPDDPGWKYSCQVVTDKSKQIHTVTVDILAECISSEIGADANLISGLLNIIPWDRIKEIWLYEVRSGTCTKTGFCYDELCFMAPDGNLCPSRYGNRLKAMKGSLWLTTAQPSDNGTEVKFRIDMKNRKFPSRFYLARIFVKAPLLVAGTTQPNTASTDSSISSTTEPPKVTGKSVRTAAVAIVYATNNRTVPARTTPTTAIASASSDKPSRKIAVILWAVSSCLMLTFS